RSPAGVQTHPRALLTKSLAARRSSSAATRRPTVVGSTRSARPAAERLPSRWTARKKRKSDHSYTAAVYPPPAPPHAGALPGTAPAPSSRRLTSALGRVLAIGRAVDDRIGDRHLARRRGEPHLRKDREVTLREE